MVEKVSKERNLNIELCRIFAMFIIVLNHFAGYIVDLQPGVFENSDLWRVFLRFMNFGGKIGVNVFVIITGYFMVRSKFKLRKLFAMWTEVLTFSVGIYIISLLLGIVEFSLKDLVIAVMPVSFNCYWFFTVYIVLYILSPIINKLINAMNKRELWCVAIGGFAVFCLWPTIVMRDIFHSELLWFIYLYIVGGGLRNCTSRVQTQKSSLYFILMVINILFVQVTTVLIDYSPTLYSIFDDILYFRNMNIVTGFSCSVLIFLFFRSLKLDGVRCRKTILFFSTSAFAVYLLHMNHYIYKLIWTDLFQCSLYLEKWYFTFLAFGWCFLVYLAGVVADRIRLVSTNRIALMFYDYAYEHVKFISKLESFINLNLR